MIDLTSPQAQALGPVVAAYPHGVDVDPRKLDLVRAYAGLEVHGLVTIKDADRQRAFATPQGRAFHNRSVF